MPEDRASRDGLLYLKEEELRSVLRTVPISDVYCVEDTVFARGKFATVRRALHKTTGVQYAAKYIKKRRRNINMVPEIHHEISVLLKCSSNNRVVRLYEVYETNMDMVLILGLAAGGELQRIFDGDQCLDENEARGAMRQILEGLCYLHERNIAHLDLKPQNILLMVEDSCDDIKLCDFGISRLLEPGTEVRTLSGTPDYVAPEVVSYEPISLATDIWSVGVLAYVLLSGYTPFGADTKEKTSLNISKGVVTFEPEDFADVSAVALDFIKCILVLNPKQRPTAQQLLQHPWLSPQSHILPTLSLKPPTAEPLTVTPKTTPISQRGKSQPSPLPAEIHHHATTPPSNGRTTPAAAVFNGTDNLNGVDGEDDEQRRLSTPARDEINGENGPQPEDKQTSEENPTTQIEEIEKYLPDVSSVISPHTEAVSPTDVLSEASSEEIEENFYLLTTIEKPTFAFTELRANVTTNAEIELVGDVKGTSNEAPENDEHSSDNAAAYRSFLGELLHEDFFESEPHAGPIPKDREEITEITVDCGNSAYEDKEVVSEVFVNTFEVDKQILVSIDCAEEGDAEVEPILKSVEVIEVFQHHNGHNNEILVSDNVQSVEVLTNDSDRTGEIEYCSETSEIFINTYEIKDEK